MLDVLDARCVTTHRSIAVDRARNIHTQTHVHMCIFTFISTSILIRCNLWVYKDNSNSNPITQFIFVFSIFTHSFLHVILILFVLYSPIVDYCPCFDVLITSTGVLTPYSGLLAHHGYLPYSFMYYIISQAPTFSKWWDFSPSSNSNTLS